MECNFRVLLCCFIFVFCFCELAAQPNSMDGELNAPCNSIKDCRYFGYVCRQNICQCDQWYVPDNERRTCVGGVDQKCLYDEHCIFGAFCMNQSICKCKHSSSQVLENGLLCAGGSNLEQHQCLRTTNFVIGIFLWTFARVFT